MHPFCCDHPANARHYWLLGIKNDVRPSVVGRKRWRFIGHPDAGWRSAVIYTIIQSCRRRGINPQEYLTDVLGRLPAMKNHEVKDVLPSRWKPDQVLVLICHMVMGRGFDCGGWVAPRSGATSGRAHGVVHGGGRPIIQRGMGPPIIV